MDRNEKAARATEEARQASDADIEVLPGDGSWIVRVGDVRFPAPDLFDRGEPDWTKWADRPRKHIRDAEDYWFHVYTPAAGDVVVDIGAGRGEDVFAFSRAIEPGGRVWAIEAHPGTFAILDDFCRLNGLDNVVRLNYACVDRPGPLQSETLPVWESNFVRPGPATPGSHPVEGVTFDSLADRFEIGRIDFLKMNIEGAERSALPGCREALNRTSNVCVAAHDFRAERGEGADFRTLAFVRDFLAAAGFELTTRDEDPRYYVPYHVHGVRR